MPGDCYTATFTGIDCIYSADMSTNPNWTLDAGNPPCQWQYGVPQGEGGDPSSGYAGGDVIGYNLSGDYQANMSGIQYATTPTFSTLDYSQTALSFWRWLGVAGEPSGNATIDVWDGVSWISLWANGTTAINDNGWQLCTYTLPSTANDSPTVRIRFGMGPTDGSRPSCGWNIDDLTVTGVKNYSDTEGAEILSASIPSEVDAAQSSVVLAFNQPMDTTSFSIATGVEAFSGPQGDLRSQITGFTWLNFRQLEIQFSPQSDPGQYTLVVGPDIDTDGPGFNPMDQNQKRRQRRGRRQLHAHVQHFEGLLRRRHGHESRLDLRSGHGALPVAVRRTAGRRDL